jgi:DNA-binding NtrC family response regulator
VTVVHVARILVVEADRLCRWALHEALTEAGFEVVESNGDERLESVKGIDVLILDATLPQGGAMQAFQAVRTQNPWCEVILMTVLDDVSLVRLNPPSRAWRVMQKPFDVGRMVAAVVELASLTLVRHGRLIDHPLRLLLVEDDPVARHVIDRTLTRLGHHVWTGPSVFETMAIALDMPKPPDVAVIDPSPAAMSAVACAKHLRRQFPAIRLVFPDQLDIVQPETLGTFLPMPFALPELLGVIGVDDHGVPPLKRRPTRGTRRHPSSNQ